MNIYLKPADIGDCDILFEWANDPETRRQSFNSNPIAYEDHVSWFNSKLQSPDSRIFILYSDDSPCGTIRLDRINDSSSFLISYNIAPQARGRGLGKEILRLAFKEVSTPSALVAFVKPENIASRHCFESLGFRRSEESENEIKYEMTI